MSENRASHSSAIPEATARTRSATARSSSSSRPATTARRLERQAGRSSSSQRCARLASASRGRARRRSTRLATSASSSRSANDPYTHPSISVVVKPRTGMPQSSIDRQKPVLIGSTQMPRSSGGSGPS